MKISRNKVGQASSLSTVARQTGWKPVLLCLFMFLGGCSKPTLPEGGFAAKAVLSTDELHVGDVATLTLTAQHAPGSTVQFPDIGNRKEVIVRGRSSDTSVPSEGVLQTEQIIQLSSLRPGNWLITTNPVICTFSDGAKKAQALPALTLNVRSTLTNKNATRLSDIKGPIRTLPHVLKVLLLIAAAAVVAGLVTLLIIRRKKAALEPEPVIAPHIIAQRELDKLRTEKWIPEPFFVKLSLILRTYLEDRFDLNAPESTTEELAAKLNHDTRLTLKDQNALRTFFTQADLVKFARAGAEQDVMRTAFSTVEEFVSETAEHDQAGEETQ